MTLPDGTFVEYVHDPLGRRIAKKINGATVEKYIWAGLTRLLAVYDGSGSLKMRFEYADGRMPYAMTRGGATYYLTYDQVGTLRTVADSSGNVIKKIDYDAFGNIIADSNPTFEIPFGFAGGLHDRDTGLIRFGYRDYDPETGRWTAKDPIFFGGGITDLYGYVLNDPINAIDPLGLTREQILEAYLWIETYHPEITQGVDPTFFDVNLPWDGGIALPLDIILIDTEGLESMEWIVNMVAHELLHAQPGTLSHDEIYKKAEEIRSDYMNRQERIGPCN